jgi:hypothetical protein
MNKMTLPVFLALLTIAPCPALAARCNASPDLSTQVAEFEVLQVSPVEALLKLGERYDLCFGIENVDQSLLTKVSNFKIPSTTMKGAIESILTSGPPFGLEIHHGVIEIRPKPEKRSLFDTVLPNWTAQRGPLQLVNWLLKIQVHGTLDPRAKGGYGGNSPGGDPYDEIGPFNESGQPIRYLLDKIVAQSGRGASWIAQIPPGSSGKLILSEGKSAWRIVEYQVPDSDYSGELRAAASQLP